MTELDRHPCTGEIVPIGPDVAADRPHGLDDLDDLDDDGDEEWLGGLRAAGLPLRRPSSTLEGPSPGLRQLLDEATPAASAGLRELVANSVAEATRTAYERDWADFELFCRVHGHGDPLDATALVVGEYINDLVRDAKAYPTLARRVAAIGFCQQLATGRRVTRDPLVTTALAGARRLLAGRGTRQAIPLRLTEMRAITTGLPIVAPNRPTMRRDQLLVTLGWASALRASELVSLDVDDLTVVGDPATGDGGLLIRVRTGKGAQGVEWVAVPFASQWAACPVRRTIAQTRGLRAGPVFRHIDRHGRTHGRLSARAVTDAVRRAITDTLRIDAAGYTSHSLRAGLVTEARNHGVPDDLIARHTRHTRPGRRRGGILNVYDRPADLFERPALDPSWW